MFNHFATYDPYPFKTGRTASKSFVKMKQDSNVCFLWQESFCEKSMRQYSFIAAEKTTDTVFGVSQWNSWLEMIQKRWACIFWLDCLLDIESFAEKTVVLTKSISAKLTTQFYQDPLLWRIPGLEETCCLGRPWGHRLLRKTTVADESPQGEKTLSRMMKELKMPWL